MTSFSSDHLAILRDRAMLLAEVRAFFSTRGVTEVDCPMISSAASVDAHIDLIKAIYSNNEIRYLISSPEYAMKRLLVIGMGDIYQLSHVFRDGEFGNKHNPEFMMVEWYRLGISFEQMIQETVDFVRLFLGNLPFHILSYREAFQKYAGIDYTTSSEKDLLSFINSHHIEVYPHILEEGKDALLNLILAVLIEPKLGQNGLCVLAHYPASQCALAKTCIVDGEHVAERFEIYFKGLELCNGYHELTDAVEQCSRFVEANKVRIALGKNELPIDTKFLKSLEKGLPDCCGVAVGFDRLMMLRHGKTNIAEVLPLPWNEA